MQKISKKDVEILGIVGTVVESNNINTRNITSNGVFAAEHLIQDFLQLW